MGSSKPPQPSGVQPSSRFFRVLFRCRAGGSRTQTWKAPTPPPSAPSRRRPWPRQSARTHWRSTARLGEIQVKEFDLEQTADVWLFVDLDCSVQTGEGDASTLEESLRIAASIAHDAIIENRAVGLTTSGHRTVSIPADRGPRQRQKIMQLLAAVDGDGNTPLAELLLNGLPLLRRGMTAVIVTPSRDRHWVRTLTGLRSRGVAAVVVALDGRSYEIDASEHTDAGGSEHAAQEQRALKFALAEYDLKVYEVRSGDNLGAVLA